MNTSTDNAAPAGWPARLAEAGWLAMLALTPVFFNPYVIQAFEPAKAALVFALAMPMACAIIRHGWPMRARTAIRIPVILGVIFVLLTQTISTSLAVSPMTALLGSYNRAQGLTTSLAWCVLFMALVTFPRHPRQLDRILATIALGSLPVGLYGLAQRFGLDPQPWSDDMTWRCAGTAGNPVLLGAYLVMLPPLTICLLWRALQNIRQGSGRAKALAWTALYAGALLVQCAALWASGSRGPLIGGAAGLFTFMMLNLITHGRRRLAGIFVAAGLTAALLVVVQQIHFPAKHVYGNATHRLFAKIMDLEIGTGPVRMAIWRATARLTWPHPPPAGANAAPDRLHPLRPVIGYGPECLARVFDPVYPVELDRLEAKDALPDRAHNQTWDTLAATGIIGLGAVWMLQLALWHCGLKQIGLIHRQRDAAMLTLACLLGALGGASALMAWRGVALAGLGFSAGMIFGLLCFTIRLSPHRMPAPHPAPDDARAAPWARLTGTALLAGITAHIVEIQFGFTSIVTGTLFWTYAALLVALDRMPAQTGAAAPKPAGAAGWRVLAPCAILALALVAGVSLRPMYANLLFTRGMRRHQTQDLAGAMACFQQAARWAPMEAAYHAMLGKSRCALARQLESRAQRDALMEQAAQDLERARLLNPLRSEHTVNLAGLYATWAAFTETPDARRDRARRADEFYAQALAISPNHTLTWNERALLHWHVLAAPARAESYLLQAEALDPDFPWTHELLGDYYARLGYATAPGPERTRHLRRALDHYEKVADLALTGLAPSNPFELYRRMAYVSRDMDDAYHLKAYGAEALRLAPIAQRPAIEKLLESSTP